MRVRTYNNLVRNLNTFDANAWSDVMNHLFQRNFGPYDYARHGGSSEQASEQRNGQNGQNSQGSATLPLDVWVTAEAYKVTAYVPGVDPETVEITFEGDELTIRGQLPQAEEGAEYVKRELYHGSVERRLNFNVPVNADGIEAHFNNGLLTLIVPKAEAVRPKQIKIQTKSVA